MKQQTKTTTQLTYNEAVQYAYFKILKLAKQQIATIEQEELRYSLTRRNDHILHEFLNPLLYLRLECHAHGLYSIHFGIETFKSPNEYSKVTASFIRALYKLTSKDTSEVNIENCIRVDWLLTNCSEVYEHTEEHSSQHTFELIKHKVTASQRKRLLSVA